MIKGIKKIFINLDDFTYIIIKKGIKLSFLITIISTLILLIYQIYLLSPILYHIGIALFKTSIYFIIEFIICGIVVDSIKKETI